MNLQPLIDNLPMILVSLGFLLWAVARVLDSYARRDPAINEWDKRAETMHKVSAQYAQAIEWLASAGIVKWGGAEKLAELNKRVKEFEQLWSEGRYIEALSNLSGFYQSAMSKVQAAQAAKLPFVSPSLLSTNLPQSQVPSGIPDSMENSVAVDSSAGPGLGEGTKR